MTAELISGTEISKAILEEIKQEVTEMKEKSGKVPGLVTILVGENPASISYVTLKVKTALNLGFKEIQDNQPEDISEADLLALIDKYNNDPEIHGILVGFVYVSLLKFVYDAEIRLNRVRFDCLTCLKNRQLFS